MINFERLVESLILAEASGQNLAYYFGNTSELTKLKDFLFKAFDVPTDWPDPVTIFAILASVASRGGTQNYQRFYDYFPAIDFAWFVLSKHPNSLDPSTGPDISSDIDNLETEFINTCARNNSISYPLASDFSKKDPVCTYSPVSVIGNKEIIVVRKNYGCKPGALGAKALENFIKNKYGLLQAIAHIADMSKSTRTIVTRTQLIPIVDKDIRDVFRFSQDYVVGAPKGGVTRIFGNLNPNPGTVATRNPKQIPTRLKSIKAESIMEMADLVKAYAAQYIVPKTTPPTPTTEKDIDKVLDTKVAVIANNSDEISKAIIAWIVMHANVEPGKKDYAGLQSGAAKLASAASGGVQFGK
jgi:hypothetical protein